MRAIRLDRSNSAARQVREFLRNGGTEEEAAKRFGISKKTVQRYFWECWYRTSRQCIDCNKEVKFRVHEDFPRYYYRCADCSILTIWAPPWMKVEYPVETEVLVENTNG